jgi:serine/threonine-protein kinase
MTLCPACKTEIPDGVSACPECGKASGQSAADSATEVFDSSADQTRLFAHTPGMTNRGPTFAQTPGRHSGSTSIESIDHSRFLPGTILAERYRIVGLVGSGGMGEVYRADDLKLAQPVALKFLPAHLLTDGAALARFHREVRIARQVSHRNVCRVYDIGEVDGQQYLSMEFIKGEELSSLLRRIGRLPADKALEIARQLCAGLAAAHDRGVLHRDLKPANVMIDSDGNVRITDFGIAGLVEEIRDEEVRAGTPAYMSPEQIAGGELTIRSDIYSLGLVLYELFTGKKAFDAPTLIQLMHLRNSETVPTTPSTLIRDIDPLVERVILRCIEKDPERRPSSAIQVAASLPGGDPLAAALAAGETPSPEMVAAASRESAIKPVAAVALLAAVLIAFIGLVLLSDKVQLHRRVLLEKSPEALQERARTVVRKLGYTDQPADSTYGLGIDGETLSYVFGKKSVQEGAVANSQPAIMYFWYRQSPRYLIPRTQNATRARLSDPPELVPGMATVFLDPFGRLLEFHSVPPQVEATQAEVKQPDWAPLFEEAGLDLKTFTAKSSGRVPPFNSDNRTAWVGTFPNQPETPITVEAASFKGKVVFFEITGAWNQPGEMQAFQQKGFLKILNIILLIWVLSLVVVAVLLAIKNLRGGYSDRKGGGRLAIYIFVVLMISWVFRAHHYAANEEFNIFLNGVEFALFPTVVLWLCYVALEPYVRRWWPHRIVSWSRLLAGDFRDPLVGRDVLIGAVFGMAIALVGFLRGVVPVWLGRPRAPLTVNLDTLLGLREAIGEFFYTTVSYILLIGLSYMFVLVVLYMILRRKDWLVSVMAWLMVTILLGLGGRSLIASLLFSGTISALVLIVATRFGLLALIASQFFLLLLTSYPLTTDFSIWYASSTIFSLGVGVAVAAAAFYVALAGQKVFKGGLLKE